ncbi:unnamed protein product [Miscanthus lutarioriparius]|uniref:Phytocyanin domain-containing protein n=1 Tax=Miscanthus lutarioriparius TaxID=422564 RepID=A0A811P022_9POAL|nr:unnamed protein product [Miscanthus lutarioriparius]
MGDSQVWSSVPACLCLVIVVGLAAVVCSSEAYVFYAGGRDGWVLDPTESYNHWAGRNRFQVNHTIVFTHEKGVDSVLQVTEQDFDTCNTRNPVRRLQAAVGSSGSSVFRLDQSGPFFFISSDEDRCQKGQKLYIIVMAVRRPTTPPESAVAPAPESAFPPAPSPVWASAPENAHAPPPTAGASRLVIDEAIIGSVVGVIGALVLCAV